MTPEIKRLNIIGIKKKHFSDSLLFAPAFVIADYKTTAELAQAKEFPELSKKNVQLRKDSTIVFKDYTDQD